MTCICGNAIEYSGRGRPPKYCQQSCRQAAYLGRARVTKRVGGCRHDGWTQTKQNEVNRLRAMGLRDDVIAQMWRCRPEDLPEWPRALSDEMRPA